MEPTMEQVSEAVRRHPDAVLDRPDVLGDLYLVCPVLRACTAHLHGHESPPSASEAG